MGLTKLAISRPVTMLILMVLAIMIGYMSWNGMRKELQPEVNFGVISVTTIYPGAGPDEVATLLSRRIEEGLSGVPGLREVTSNSQEGVSVVVGQFEVGTNMDEALNEARAKIDGIVGRLPDGAEKPGITKFDTASDPVLRLVLNHPNLSGRDLRDLADDKIKDRFSRIPGVASVNVSGGDIREIQIQVRREALLAYKIGAADVLRAVQAATLNVPSGRMLRDNTEYSVRVLGEFKTVEDIKTMVLSITDRSDQNGRPIVVSLGSVANVVDSIAERRSYSRLDGSDAVSVQILKARSGNSLQIVADAEKVIKSIEKDFGIGAVKTFNQAEDIEESLADLIVALFLGIALVTLIVYVFLHNFRGTMIVGIAIPVCLFTTFIVLSALGFTINTMTMLALSLAIGVLVDDAIVVLENIFRHLKMGENPVEAAINGRAEIGLAAIAITLADVVVFIPIANMGGVVGQFFKPMGIGFAVATLISLFVSFTITPMLASRWYKPGEDVEHFTKGFPFWFENRFDALKAHYGRALEWALNHRWFVFISGFVALIGVFMFIAGTFAESLSGAINSGIPMFAISTVIGLLVFVINIFRGSTKPGRILAGVGFGAALVVFCAAGFGYAQWKGEAVFKFAFFPPSDSGSVQVGIALPAGASLATTQEVVEQIEQKVMSHPDVEFTVSDIGSRGGGGFGGGSGDNGTNYASVRATLHDKQAILDRFMFWKPKPKHIRTVSDSSVAADILQTVGKIPGVEATVAAGSNFGFGAPVQLSFRSDDRDLLLKVATEIKNRLEDGAVKGVVSPDLSSRPGKPEIRAIPDRIRLADYGVTSAEVANTMRILYEGDNTTKFRVKGKEYDIRVMMDLTDRNDPDAIDSIPITFTQGKPVYLGTVSKIVPGVGVDKINRRDREEEVIVTANLLPGYAAGTVQSEIEGWLKKEKLVPAEVTLKPLGQADLQARESGYLMTALLLGFVLVYMLLASLYENLLYPFIIQLAQPQAMVGALLALLLTDKTLNLVGFVGIIALVGLVGKNAILLVDYTNTLRGRGLNRHDALVESGPTRLRPILMTTLALILGMLPVALAIGAGSEFRETIGITIIGGITLSTMLTLLVIPCSYTIFDDLSIQISKVLGRTPKEVGEQET